MKILGIDMRQPTMLDFLVSVVVSTVVMAIVALVKRMFDLQLDRPFAAFLFVSLLWTIVGRRIGIRVERGPSHYLLNLAGCILFGVFAATVWLFFTDVLHLGGAS